MDDSLEAPARRTPAYSGPGMTCAAWLVVVGASRGWPTTAAQTLPSPKTNSERARDTGGHDVDASSTELEGDVTKMIESQTARIPPGTYLSLAILSMVGSLLLMLMGERNVANFVGQWAPTISSWVFTTSS